MKAAFTRSRMNRLSNYGQNALIQLVAALGVGFILTYAMYVIVLILSPEQKILVNGALQTVTADNAISPYIALQSFSVFLHRPWILLTYGWAHVSFFPFLSNMLWLYCFGSVVQSLIGFKEIIPLYIFAYVLSGCLFLGANIIWPHIGANALITGSIPSTMAFAIGAITIAPKFKFYLGENLSIPLWAILALFLILNILNFANGNYAMMILCAGGALVGFSYVKLLKSGRHPGGWMYRISGNIQSWFTPDEYNEGYHQRKRMETFKQIQPKNKPSEESIDSILDKINMKGYDSLTAEEKEVLMKASKES
jgi:membrane associated rhomboid family serine protease